MPARPPGEVLAEQASRRVLARLQQADEMMHSLGFFQRLTATLAETAKRAASAQHPRGTMSNNGNFTHLVRPTAFSGMGWADARAGKPYPAEYDTWTEKDQRHYERGRLRFAGAGLAGYRRPPATEPANIVERTNGLRLVPKRAAREERVPVADPAARRWY